MATFTIDEKNFLEGESIADYVVAGGFSPDSHDINLLKSPGVAYGSPSGTNVGGATLTGSPIAYAYDKNFLGNDAYIMDDACSFYTKNGATFTKRQTPIGSSADPFTTQAVGTDDLLQFKGDTFATAAYGAGAGEIIRMADPNLAIIDSQWWTVTQGQTSLSTGTRWPLEVVEDKMYIGNKNVIATWDGAASVAAAITLPTDAWITSLRRHPDGRHLIAFCGYTANYSHTAGGPGKIYIINKDTKQWEREILVDTQIEGSRNVGGIIYVTYGSKLGYFTGSGIKFLKKLQSAATVYSQQMGNLEDILLVPDGSDLRMFGDFGRGKRWVSAYRDAGTIKIAAYIGSSVVMVGTNATKLWSLDYTTSSTSFALVSHRYKFGSVVKIGRIDIIHDQITATVGSTDMTLYYRDENNVLNQLFQLTPVAGSIFSKSRANIDVMCDVFQLELLINGGADISQLGIKLIRIYYEPIN